MSELQKFLFEGLPVRGVLVQLTDAWQEILNQQRLGHSHTDAESADAPNAFNFPAVSELVGEMVAATVLLHASVKFKGALILQIQGDGPLKLAVAEVQSDMGVRATAKVTGSVPAMGGMDALCNVHGQGRCAMTLDPQDRQPGQQAYQGIVSLADAQGQPLVHLSQVIEGYMQQSEQLPTRVILAADDRQACGLLIQRLPLEGEKNLGLEQQAAMDEGFNRIAVLAQSLKRDELLTLSVQEILQRLFWQEDVRLFDKQTPYFHCNCSRERVGEMLRSLGREEIDSIISEQGQVEVGCDFCNAVYQFDSVDASKLFVPDDQQAPGSKELH